MLQINDTGLAVLLVAIGLSLFLVVFLMLKLAPRLRYRPQQMVALGMVSPTTHVFSDIREITELAAEERRQDASNGR